jgi:hypothetical protein
MEIEGGFINFRVDDKFFEVIDDILSFIEDMLDDLREGFAGDDFIDFDVKVLFFLLMGFLFQGS